jgi:hypothetical protein
LRWDEPAGGPLELLVAPLGLLGPPGGILGPPGGLLGLPGGLLGPPGCILGSPVSPLGPPGGLLGPPGGLLGSPGASWGAPGASWGPPGVPWGPPGVPRRPPRRSKGPYSAWADDARSPLDLLWGSLGAPGGSLGAPRALRDPQKDPLGGKIYPKWTQHGTPEAPRGSKLSSKEPQGPPRAPTPRATRDMSPPGTEYKQLSGTQLLKTRRLAGDLLWPPGGFLSVFLACRFSPWGPAVTPALRAQ